MTVIDQEFLRFNKVDIAKVLLLTTLDFLERNQVPKSVMVDLVEAFRSNKSRKKHRQTYQRLMRAYLAMGRIVSTWHSNPRFLDQDGLPVPISTRSGTCSLRSLIKAARVRIDSVSVLALLKNSPSVEVTADGSMRVLRRVFVLPEFELLRGAFVVSRYLETLSGNTAARKVNAPLLLERNCYVSPANLKNAERVLRDVKERATAFMDSVDGELEECRVQCPEGQPTGEIGVFTFAWSERPNRLRVSKSRRQLT